MYISIRKWTVHSSFVMVWSSCECKSVKPCRLCGWENIWCEWGLIFMTYKTAILLHDFSAFLGKLVHVCRGVGKSQNRSESEREHMHCYPNHRNKLTIIIQYSIYKKSQRILYAQKRQLNFDDWSSAFSFIFTSSFGIYPPLDAHVPVSHEMPNNDWWQIKDGLASHE
jgi:hypothetical protein